MVSENTKNKNPKIKSFFFFLLLATLFWFLTKFSKESETNLTTSINYINVPGTVIVTNDNVKEISFNVSGNGFKLLSHKLKKSSLNIDVSRYYKQSDSIIIFSELELQKLIVKQLNLTEINSLSETELVLHLDKNASKKVPINFRSELLYRDGFFQQGKIKIEPDSVRVSGPSGEIDTITLISTTLLKRKDITEGFTDIVNLVKPQNKNIILDTENISVTVVAEEFSQMKMQIPVEVVNLPEDITLKLFPDSIEITFDVSIKDFGNLSIQDFKIICDFSERIEDGSFMIPKLTKFPEILQHIEFDTKKVEYLIFK